MRRAGADAASIAQGTDQLQVIASLMRNVGTASPGNLAAFREQVATVIAQSTAAVSAARDAAAATMSAGEVARISAETRRQTEELSRDMYERRIFDPYLKFASAEEEDAYRRREAEAKRYMDAELAKGTPEGDLNAAGAAQGQMLDAAAHGAADSPEFKERWEALEKTAREQREAVRASGGSTEEYDRRLEESVRRFLKSKGLSDEEIDAAIAAAGDDPIQAVKPYLEAEEDTRAIEGEVRGASRLSHYDALPIAEGPAVEPGTKNADVADVFAEFQKTGVQHTGDGSGHGLGGGKLRDRDGPPIPA